MSDSGPITRIGYTIGAQNSFALLDQLSPLLSEVGKRVPSTTEANKLDHQPSTLGFIWYHWWYERPLSTYYYIYLLLHFSRCKHSFFHIFYFLWLTPTIYLIFRVVTVLQLLFPQSIYSLFYHHVDFLWISLWYGYRSIITSLVYFRYLLTLIMDQVGWWFFPCIAEKLNCFGNLNPFYLYLLHFFT